MSKKIMVKSVDYHILDWDIAAFLDCCGTILANTDHHINRIRINNTKEVYLVPQDFYLAAKECLKKERTKDQQSKTKTKKLIITATNEEQK